MNKHVVMSNNHKCSICHKKGHTFRECNDMSVNVLYTMFKVNATLFSESKFTEYLHFNYTVPLLKVICIKNGFIVSTTKAKLIRTLIDEYYKPCQNAVLIDRLYRKLTDLVDKLNTLIETHELV